MKNTEREKACRPNTAGTPQRGKKSTANAMKKSSTVLTIISACSTLLCLWLVLTTQVTMQNSVPTQAAAAAPSECQSSITHLLNINHKLHLTAVGAALTAIIAQLTFLYTEWRTGRQS